MLKIAKWLVIAIIAFIVGCNVWIVSSTQQGVIEDMNKLTATDVGLVFGTSQYLINGQPNLFFSHRITSAKYLLEAKMVNKLILSGSKDSIYYDEAEAMRQALVDLQISNDALVLDKYGNRTIESLYRLRNTYGYNRCILVTQKYHAYRCLFIADRMGLDVQCFVAETPDKKAHIKTIAREVLARTKAVIDLYLLL